MKEKFILPWVCGNLARQYLDKQCVVIIHVQVIIVHVAKF